MVKYMASAVGVGFYNGFGDPVHYWKPAPLSQASKSGRSGLNLPGGLAFFFPTRLWPNFYVNFMIFKLVYCDNTNYFHSKTHYSSLNSGLYFL